jgi:hypothetical protein
MPRIMLPSLLVFLTAGCNNPVPPVERNDTALVRAEVARARYREIQEAQKPQPAPAFVSVRLERGAFTEDGVTRTGSSIEIRIPRTP